MKTEESSKSTEADLNEDEDRGEISEKGFKDYDKEFHPADVDNDPESTANDEETPARKTTGD